MGNASIADPAAVSHCDQQRLDDAAAGGSSSGFEFVLGISLSLGASIFSNVGLNLQKFSLMREKLRPSGLVRGYIRQPLWWMGIFLVVFFSFGDFAALIFISQSVAAPLGGSTMVTNVILAHCWLGEPFTQRDAVGVGIILVGLSLVGVFGSRSSQCYTMDELEGKATEPDFLNYVLAVLVLLVGLYGSAKLLSKRRAVMGEYSPAWVSTWAKRERFILPALSGLLGGQTVLLAKGIAEVLESQSGGEPQLQLPGFWLLVLGMLSFIMMQIHWMAVAMKLYDNMYLQPVFQSFFLGSATLGGVVCFNELATVGKVERCIFGLGMAMLLLGVVVLTGRQQLGLPPRSRFRAAVIAVVFVNALLSSAAASGPVREGGLPRAGAEVKEPVAVDAAVGWGSGCGPAGTAIESGQQQQQQQQLSGEGLGGAVALLQAPPHRVFPATTAATTAAAGAVLAAVRLP